MSITWEETRDSPKIKGRSSERRYVGWGSTSGADMRVALLAASPILYGMFVRKDCEVSPHEEATDIWDGVVTYELANDEDEADLLPPTFRFSTAGGKTKMTVAYETTHAYAAEGYTAQTTDDDNLIGVTSEGAEGVEVEAPGFSWQETWKIPAASMTWNYAKAVRNAATTTNNASFRAFAAGEVLFLYADGGSQGDDTENREVTFHFASSPNVTDLVVGTITGIAKKGWEFLDIRFRTEVTGEGPDKRTTKKPIRVYTKRVYRESNFSALGIGG